MTAITADTIVDLGLQPRDDLPEVSDLDIDRDSAPGMPLLGFMVAMALSAVLWALIGFTAWALIS